MKRKTFTKLKANLLTIDDLYSLVKTTCERTIILSSLYYDNLYKQYVEMRANNEKMCLQASIPARNELTEQLNEMNVARNVCFEEIKREIYFNLNHRNKPGRLAAHELHHFFEPYWKSPIENPNIQSEIFHNLLTKYLASPDLMANVSILGLEMLLSNLESTNSRYDSLVKARSMEIDARELMGKELKPLVVKNYVDFCKAVEEIVNFSISSDVIFLFNKINEVRKTYTTLKETAEKYGLFFLKRAN